MHQPLFFPADAHEGPVWVAAQHRLYYATGTHPDGRRRVAIDYLDFSRLTVPGHPLDWAGFDADTTQKVVPQTFVHDARLANGMQLSADGRSLLVTEQGDDRHPAAISRVFLADKRRQTIVSHYKGIPFNSPNKVVETQRGDLIFTDPDYGFRNSFGPPPELEPCIYVLKTDGSLTQFRCRLEMPHGLALSPDETSLFVSDTSNEGVHADGIHLDRCRHVYRFDFDPATATISGKGISCFAAEEGVPDGMLCTHDRLLAACGDGVYVADLTGQLVGKIPTPNSVVNLALADGERHLFVTADASVILFRDWRLHLKAAGTISVDDQ